MNDQETLISCRHCGQQNSSTAKFCAKCGTKIGVAASPQGYSSAKPPLVKLGWILLLTIPAAAVGLVAFSFLSTATGSSGGIAQKILNSIIFLIGALGVVVLSIGTVLLTMAYKRKPK